MRIASGRESDQFSCLSFRNSGTTRGCSTKAGLGPSLRAASGDAFESSATLHATAPSPAVKNTTAKNATAVIRNFPMIMALDTPLTSTRTDAETSPAVIQRDRAIIAPGMNSSVMAPRAPFEAIVAASAAPGARPSRIRRSRRRWRPRKRQLLTVPTGQPIRRAASSQV